MKYNPDYSSRFRILKGGKISLVVSALLGGVTISFAAPTGGVVTSGVANISQSGSVTNITQSTSKAAINWQKFSIGAHETVNFKQPDVNSITLNRVIGNERSVINGALNANGQVWILNSNGVLFGKGARINTAGLLATTKNITDADFMAGKYNFKGDSTASVINLGEIDISNSGYATLLANSVTNEGTIRAVRGSVHLVGANEVTINLNGNSIVDLRVDKGVLDALVENKGAVYADGGEIYLTTNAVNELLKGVVNNTGIVEANSLDGITGFVEVFAHGGEANIAGTITALDGFVETSGDRVKIDDSFRVVADKWLIDPTDFTIAATGGDMTGATLSTNLATANVEIQSVSGTIYGKGDIYVNDTILWSSDKKLTLNAQNDTFINKDITASDANGKLELLYGQKAVNAGNTSNYYVNAKVNLQAGDNFFTKLGSDGASTIYTVVTDATAMQVMTLNDATKNYALGTDLTLSGENNWTPIGNYDSRFKGKFDGLGHTVSNVNIKVSANHSGFFGATGESSSIRNIRLTNINYTGELGEFAIGGLVGIFSGDISNVSVSGTMTIPGSFKIGGIVGQSSGNIKNTYSNVNIKSTATTGGIVGMQFSGSVENSYALGDITSHSSGGLIGEMNSGATLKNSYASNTVSGNQSKGLISNTNTEITNSYYDKTINAGMSNEATYGKTKSEILAAFAGKDGWSTEAGGASVVGYEVIELPYLTNVTVDADKSVKTLFEGGMGVDGNAYTITNWTQLQNLNHSNILSQNYFFSLLNSIDSSTADYTDLASATANGGKGWNSIGNSASQFKGNFDGTNKTISNLYINDATSDYIGLFGYINSATIKNIGVVNANVSGKDDVGGLVGFAKNSTIESSYTTGAVSGNGAVGGLVGLNLGLDGDAIIKNSYSTANVTGGSSTGGLVGKNGAEINGAEPAKATIENSYATGKVTGTSNVGGLVGHNEAYVDGGSGTSTATIKNSYATGEVSGTSSSGGLIGLNKIYVYGGSGTATVTVIDSFFTKEADDTTTVGIGGNSASQTGVTGKTTAEMKNIATFTGWDTNIWSFDSSKVAGNALDAQIYLKHVTRAEDIVAGEKLFEGGFGTADSAYTITNWTQLQNINHANILSKSYYFSLLNDLGSSTSDYTNLASATANGGKGWKAIGSSSSNKFVGNFDGTNKTISDLSINDTSKDRLGLFGYTDSATIKNIGVVNADVSGESYVGALVGFAKNSIIENSYAIGGNIHGSSENIGGLVGNSEQSNIRNSYAINKVTGSDELGGYVGGLVGTNYGGTIENSYAIGEVVSVGTKVGGLVGKDSGTIKNSYATGKVTGADQVGGLAGAFYGANIENSYATGQVVATNSLGGLVGVNYNGGTITNSFYNTSTSGQTVGIGGNSASQDGVTGKTTAQMQDKATFSDATWSIVEDSTINKGTPFLAWQDSSKGYTKVWVIGTKVAPSPDPVDPKPEKEKEVKDAEKVVISIVNKEATKFTVPKLETPLISTNIINTTSFGENKMLVSKPIEGQTTKRVSLSEAKEMQVEAGVQSSEVRVPLSRDSIIQLVDGGVKLPDGVEQEFYVVDDR